MDDIDSKYNFIDEYISETEEERSNNLANIIINQINRQIDEEHK